MQKQTVKKISGLALGSSMLLLSMIPAASAFAATAPAVTSVTLTSSVNGSATAGSNVTFTASATQTGSGTPMYQFWTESPNGNWTATGWSSSNTYTLKNVQTGSYEVVAYAADKGQTTPISSESTYSNQFVNVGTSLSFTTNANDVAPMSPVTITATAKNFTNVVYQYWIGTPNGNGGYNWVANGDYTPNNTYTFTPPTAGTYKIAVYAKDLNAPQDAQFAASAGANEGVYGTPAAVQLKTASSSLVADGTATDTVTATVVDANGNTVANFNGSAKVIIPAVGGTWTGGTNNNGNDWVWVNFTNGVGTVTLNAPSSNPNTTETINSAELMSGANGTGVAVSPIAYGNTDLSYGTPVATSISLTPTLANVSNNNATEDPVSVTINDQADQALTTGSPVYVTFTITGPGSFVQGSSVTTLSEYVTPSNTAFSLPVYSVQGVSGTIQVSASAAGLTSTPLSIGSVETTPASAFKLTSQQETLSASMDVNGTTLPAGTPYTVYSVQTVDASGTPVAAQDNLTLSDSTTANGGTEALYYYNYASGAPTTQITNGALQTSGSTGQAQFAVFNTAALTSPATITVTDTTTNTSQTASYAFQVGAPTQVQFTNAEASQSVEAGKTITYSVQLADAAGNPVSQANQPVDFYFNGNGAGATIDGGSYWNSGNPYVVDTNASGVASVTVAVPSTAAANSTFTLDAAYNGQSPVAAEANTVASPATYASSIGLNSLAGATSPNYPTAADNLSLPTSITSGQTLAQALGVSNVYAYALNSIGEVANTGDTLQVSTSNSNVLSITGATNGAATLTAGGALPTITAEQAGSATLTITDLSNPSAPSVTATIDVTGGTTPTQISTLNPAGELNTAYTFSTSGVVGPFTIETTDAGGNVIPTSAPVGLTAQQVLAAIGVTGATGIRTSAGGSDVSYVTIGANQASVQVWVDGATSGNATVPTEPALSTLTPALESATGSGTSLSLTFDSAIQSAVKADFAVSGDTVSSDSINGNTVTLTLGSALPVNATVSLAAGAVTTGYSASNAAISNYAISGAPASSGVVASGTTTTAYAAGTSATASTDTITYGTPSVTSGTGSSPASVDVNGTTYTYSGTPTGNQFDSAATLASAINGNTGTSNISATASGSTITLSDSTGSDTATLTSNDATNLTVGSGTFTGGTVAKAATPSVYTLTVNSGATATGNLTVKVMSGTTTVATDTVAVSAGDTAAQVAAAIAGALQADANVTGTFAVNYTSGATSLTLTQNTASSAGTSVSVSG